ncbi:hypothetical protein ACH6EH_01940 [Paenibacillus sp. JSM ZJ436]|uniref:hypothetical protein n=1 Tax=Paenibacillus sp. JSM ZJ436 TaxID=3376190 RepID=UPI0037A9959D
MKYKISEKLNLLFADSKGSWNLGTYNNVQANAESHATNTEMGPFRFTSVSYKNSSGVWTVNDTAPTADSPYSVSKTSNVNFRVYGPCLFKEGIKLRKITWFLTGTAVIVLSGTFCRNRVDVKCNPPTQRNIDIQNNFIGSKFA